MTCSSLNNTLVPQLLRLKLLTNDRTSDEVVQHQMLKKYQMRRPRFGRLRNCSLHLFLSAVAAVVALGSTGAPGLAHATRIGIVCSSRLST